LISGSAAATRAGARPGVVTSEAKLRTQAPILPCTIQLISLRALAFANLLMD
jgi:hypothetical protein